MSQISNRLLSAIHNSRMSYRDIENATGISRTTVQRYATGKIEDIPLTKLRKITDAIGVSAAEIMGWEATTIQDNHGIIGNGNHNCSITNNLGELEKEILSLMSKMSTKQKNALLTKAYELVES